MRTLEDYFIPFISSFSVSSVILREIYNGQGSVIDN